MITASSKLFGSAQKKHEWDKHRPEMEAQTQRAHEAAARKREEERRKAEEKQRQPEPGRRDTEKAEGTKGGGDGYKAASTAEQANVFVIRPQKYEVSSMLLLIAKQVCEVEWKWPPLAMEDWLDTYLFETLRQRGVVIGAYQLLQPSDGRPEEVKSEPSS